jgi:hypothetical protein
VRPKRLALLLGFLGLQPFPKSTMLGRIGNSWWGRAGAWRRWRRGPDLHTGGGGRPGCRPDCFCGPDGYRKM